MRMKLARQTNRGLRCYGGDKETIKIKRSLLWNFELVFFAYSVCVCFVNSETTAAKRPLCPIIVAKSLCFWSIIVTIEVRSMKLFTQIKNARFSNSVVPQVIL